MSPTSRALIAALCLLGPVPAAHTQQLVPQSIAEAFAKVPSNLDRLPADWASTKPVELVVLFNLKAEPNSPDADRFLAEWYRAIKALPDRVDLRLTRVVLPAKYTYAVSLTFRNWTEYQVYEKSPAFRKYYHEGWKPFVANAEERLSILDPLTPTPAL